MEEKQQLKEIEKKVILEELDRMILKIARDVALMDMKKEAIEDMIQKINLYKQIKMIVKTL